MRTIFLFTLLFSTSIIIAQTSISPLKPISYGSNPGAGKYISTRGINIYVETYGTGKPLLVIHGNGGSIVSMENQITCFDKSFQVIAADSRAQGKTKDSGDSLSYEMMADDLVAILDTLKLDSACIIGWSDGGIIGLLMAIRHPEKVKKLAITGANIRPDTTAFSTADFQAMKETVHLLKQKKENEADKNTIKLIQLMIDEPNIGDKELKQIRCPVLVIGGDKDIIKPEHTLEIFRHISGARLWILPGSGHATCIDFKDDFNEQVRRFLN